MRIEVLAYFAFLLNSCVLAFVPIRCSVGRRCRVTDSGVYLAKKKDLVDPEEPKFVVGEDVPEEILKHNAIYDMILVERYPAPTKTSFGLFLPTAKDKDQKHTGMILSDFDAIEL